MFFKHKKKKRIVVEPVHGGRVHKKQKAGNKKQKKEGVGFVFKLLLLIFVGVCIYVFLFSSLLTVNDIEIIGISELSDEVIKKEVEDRLSGKSLQFLPRNNLILLSSRDLEGFLLNRFKKIEKAEVEKKFSHGIKISIKERESMLVVCSASDCRILDQNGNAFLKADFESDYLKENKFLILTDESNASFDDENLLEGDYVKFILELRELLKREGDVEIVENIATPYLISGDLKIETIEGWKVFLSYDIGPQKSLDTLKASLKNIESKGERDRLEYIDLRTQNKVFYKLKNSISEPAPE